MDHSVDPMDSIPDDEVQTLSEEIDESAESERTEELPRAEEANAVEDLGVTKDANAEEELGVTDEVDVLEQPQETKKRPKIFVSHRRDFDLDQNIASLLFEELRKDADIYLDTERRPMERYNDAIRKSIEEADVVIALVSNNFNQADADWIMFELEYAYQCWKQSDHPELLPIHLEPIARYEPRIGACLGGFNRVDYRGDNAELIDEIRVAIAEDIPKRRLSISVGLEGFLVNDSQIKLMRASYLESTKLDEASRSLDRDRLIWIVGDASVRNHVALSLALKQQSVKVVAESPADGHGKIYEITKSLSWSKAHNTLISNSILIFSDIVPGILFDQDEQGVELRSLDRLINRNNTIIVTTSADSYLEVEQEMRKREFKRGEKFVVGPEFYDPDDKLVIFEQLLTFAKETGEINLRQHDWASRNEVRESLSSIILNWSPADIERFIIWHLRQAKRPGDVFKLLQRNADLDNEIHSWFASLDDSTRCFVMVLALFAGLSKEQLWVKYKAIIQKLRKLDASLSIWPLGISRERAALYVTTEGPPDFTDNRIANAIYREMAKNYREYFIELLPLMEEWSVPSGRDGRKIDAISETRRRQAIESRELRTYIAHMVGKMGQYGFDDLTKIVERWATDPILQVREAVDQSMEQAASDTQGDKQVLNILDGWCRDRSNEDGSLMKTWAAASALGTIAASNPERQIYDDALQRLKRLARDARPSTRFYVSIPLKRAAGKVPLSEEVEELLTLVVQDDSPSTKINIAEALNEGRVLREETALRVLDRWSCSDDWNQRWAAMCSVIIWTAWHKRTEEAYEDLIALVRQDAETFASVFVEIVNHKYHKKRAPSLFKQLVLRTPADVRRVLISGLAKIPFGLLDERIFPRLRTSNQAPLQSLVTEVRARRWQELLTTPYALVNDLCGELDNRQMAGEVYLALMALVKPEPEGYRKSLVNALADSFAQGRAGLDQLLAKLNDLAPSNFESLAAEVRRGILERLYYDPLVFADTVTAYLSSAGTADEMKRGLELLAQPGPEGSRKELLQALAAAHAMSPQSVTELLSLFRASSSGALRSVAYEFTFQLLQGLLSTPEEFLSKVLNAMGDNYEREEVLYILRYLAASEPQGKRKTLIRALAQARTTHSEEVDNLLQHPALMAHQSLAGLRLEVRVASFLESVFVPRFLTRFFTPRR